MKTKELKTNSGQEIQICKSRTSPQEAIGIKATIKINCETEDELITHLKVIVQELKSILKANNNELQNRFIYQDTNCYGSHSVDVDLA